MLRSNGSLWFKRLVRDCAKISPHIKFRRIKYGFYRIYWKHSYLHEVYTDMPFIGYHLEEDDVTMQESQKYFEEFEDQGELTRKVKNYYEGYWDSLDRIRTRVYMLKNDADFAKESEQAYQQFLVK